MIPSSSTAAVTPRASLEAGIKKWLGEYIADVLNLTPDGIDPDTRFERYGLDSSATIAMTSDLAEWLGCDMDPTFAYDHPTINRVATALAAEPHRLTKLQTVIGVLPEAS